MKTLVLVFFFSFFTLPLLAQSNDHPIDKFLDECMEKDMSTAGMVKCINEAYDKWDAELNRIYKLLIKKLDDKSAASLKSAQIEWIAFRDKEFILIDDIYSGLEGTMYIPMRAADRMEIVKKRVLELDAYRELLNIKDK